MKKLSCARKLRDQKPSLFNEFENFEHTLSSLYAANRLTSHHEAGV